MSSQTSRHDQVPYPDEVVDSLIDGEYWLWAGSTPRLILDAPSWFGIRAQVEQTGQVFTDAFCEVIDLERAVDKLARAHPEGAVVTVIAAWLGLRHPRVLNKVLGGHRNWGRVEAKSRAWIAAYLSGEDPEKAWREAS